MSATALRRSTPSLIAALKTALEAVQLDGAAAFAKVALFDLQSLPDALKDLLLYQARLAVIVPGIELFETRHFGRKLEVTRTLPVTLFIADRKIGNRIDALYGDGASVAGALALMEAVLAAVTGQLLSNPYGVLCTPKTSTLFAVSDTAKADPGRAAVALDLELTGGRLESTLDASPIL